MMKGIALSFALLGCAACETPSPVRRAPDQPATPEASSTGPGVPADAQSVLSSAQPPERPPSPPGGSPPPRPEEPPSPARACKQDTDCELVPDDCRKCPPCEPTWRSAANRREVQRITAERAKVECPPISCQQCDVPGLQGYLGEGAACLDGQCVAREP
jgi:hypothetical protein